MSDRSRGRAEVSSDVDRKRLATAVAEQLAQRDGFADDSKSEEAKRFWRELGRASLDFALAIDGDARALAELDREFDLLGSLLDVPSRLAAIGELELAVRVAEALKFCAPDDMKGQIALAHAQSGDRNTALELVLTNLETAREPFIAEFRAGDVYRELGEADAAEAYYRRSLALANSASQRSEVALRITSLLLDIGRESEALAFLTEQRAADAASPPERSSAGPRNDGDGGNALPKVGRNDPCPCGSGKKYKKCHGA